jgi:hypothetical protein
MTVISCKLFNHPGLAIAAAKSNTPVFSISLTLTFEYFASMILAVGLTKGRCTKSVFVSRAVRTWTLRTGLHIGLDTTKCLRVNTIDFVHDDDVCKLNLVGEEIRDGALIFIWNIFLSEAIL